jgi:two-component system, chemotaxis family, chemotaxis protein CheY
MARRRDANWQVNLRRGPKGDFRDTSLHITLIRPFRILLKSVTTRQESILTTRILIVDDSSAMRAFIRATLEESGDIDVREADNGFQALKILPRGDFDLVIIDINMPDINGLELASFMRRSERFRDTPLVVVSTEVSEQMRSRVQALGVNAYLQKPFAAEDLQRIVSDVLSCQQRKD